MNKFNHPHICKSNGGQFWYLWRDRYSRSMGIWPISRQLTFLLICADAKALK